MPKVSIIVPVYNVERYVGWCINSILKQTFRDFELILVNDGSTDGSLKILHNYQKLDNRVKVLDIPNGGVSNARNFGLEHSTGEFIQFVDSDDVIEPNYTQRLLEIIELYNADIAICGTAMETMETEAVTTTNFTCQAFGDECVLQGKNLFENLPFIIWTSCTVETPYNRIFHRRLLMEGEPIRFKKGMHYGEDFLFNLQYLKKCRKAVFFKEQLYHYMIWPGESLARKYVCNMFQGQKAQLTELRALLNGNHALNQKNEPCLANYEVCQIIKSLLSLMHEKCDLSELEKKRQINFILQDSLVQNAFKKYSYIEPLYMGLPQLIKNYDVGGVFRELSLLRDTSTAQKQTSAAATPPPAPGRLNRLFLKLFRGLQKLFKTGFVHKWARIMELNLMTVGLKETLRRMKGKISRKLFRK